MVRSIGLALLASLILSPSVGAADGPGGDGIVRPDVLQWNQDDEFITAASMAIGSFNVVKLSAASKTVANVTPCTSREQGKEVTFICPPSGDMPLFNETGNLVLVGTLAPAFTCTALATLTLYCDSTQWIESGRSDALAAIIRASDSEVLYNDSGTITGESAFVYDDAANRIAADNMTLSLNLDLDYMQSCDSDTEKMETDVNGAVACGTVPAIPSLPVSVANGGTGRTSFNADSYLSTDSFGALEVGTAKVTGLLVGSSQIQTLTNKTLTDPTVTTGTFTTPDLNGPQTEDMILIDGLVDSSVETSDTAFIFDATGGGHSGDYLELKDGGVTWFTGDVTKSLTLANAGIGVDGGFFMGGDTPATYPAGSGTQPENSFRQSYTGSLTAAKVYSIFYVPFDVKHDNVVANSDVIGFNVLGKYLNNNTTVQLRKLTGVQAIMQEFSYGGTSHIIDTMAAFYGISSINSTGPTTLTNVNGAVFQIELDTGSNKTVTKASVLLIKGPNGAAGAATTVAEYNGIEIEDLNNSQPQATAHAAIRIASQTADGSVGTDGNIEMEGGDWDDGHLQVGSGHVWFDGTHLRGETSVPTAASDGRKLNYADAASFYEAGTSTISNTTTEVTVDYDSTLLAHANITLSGGVVTLGADYAQLQITWDVTVDTTGNARGGIECWLEEDPLGVGSFANIPGTTRRAYIRVTNDGTSMSGTVILAASDTDQFQVRCWRHLTSTAATTLASGSSISFMEIN